ncbi:hypothetical protein [Facklamia sp. P12955]|uniref:hypothetical protein n=1 Tax=Facklamia sp. P12955 TaxID=3421946 RepID=UPI003D171C2E
MLEHFEKKKNTLYKIILVYRQDQRKRIDNYGSNYVGYENKQITGDGLDKEDADQIVLIMSDQSLIFDSEIIDQFDKTYSEYIEKVSKRYYQEESDLELAQENELFYFHKFDESKDFYKLVIEKDEFYSGKLS